MISGIIVAWDFWKASTFASGFLRMITIASWLSCERESWSRVLPLFFLEIPLEVQVNNYNIT
jgi:hypothetical protein